MGCLVAVPLRAEMPYGGTLTGRAGAHAGLEQRALRPLLEWAEAVVPRRQWHRTPLFLFGTAGLRKLPAEGRAALLDDVRAALLRCNFRCAKNE